VAKRKIPSFPLPGIEPGNVNQLESYSVHLSGYSEIQDN